MFLIGYFVFPKPLIHLFGQFGLTVRSLAGMLPRN